ncbi:MarR family winged helix-turn-helix transcriptional regulator [Nocardioides litoris]|uniref:MarR family winged helix-turn-helix transcriptional regulator n=1 Tax=Nocardioides litoris TaxID=1926648 RepID=UPI0011219474|nr:MarR family transcriptional regulator [Nocardioides litoris]
MADDTVLDRLLLVGDLLQRDMERAFADTPLTASRVGVLWVLGASGPSTQQAVAAALGVSARHVSGLVDVLEQHGYLTRRPHPTDRRAVVVALTPEAEQVVAAMQREHAALAADLLDAVDPADRAAFDRGLAAVTRRLAALVAEAAGS